MKSVMLNSSMMSNIVSNSNIFSIDTTEVWGRGLLLGGNPKNPRDSLYKGVILLFHQIDNSVLGLQLNRRLEGINSDLSILSALCGNQGPRLYRACVGSWRWDIETLKEQIFNLDPDVEVQDHLWEVSRVNSSLVFNYDGEAQWTRVMETSAQMQSRCWINQSFS